MSKFLTSVFFISCFVAFSLIVIYLALKPRLEKTLTKSEIKSQSFSFEKSQIQTAAAQEFIRFFATVNGSRDEVPQPWQHWDYRQSMIYANILGFPRDGELNFKVLLPKDKFGDLTRAVVSCTPEQTVRFSSKNMSYLGGNVNFFDYAGVFDGLYTYCLKEDCSEIGRVCAIIDFE